MTAFTIENGERIAQLVIAKHDKGSSGTEVEAAIRNFQGEGGFGESTGVKNKISLFKNKGYLVYIINFNEP